MSKGIYNRGYLPHWDFNGSLQARTGRLWQREYHDRYIRDMDHYHDCRSYIRNNPVKAKLCAKPEDWPYSSAGISWSGAPASTGNDLNNQAG